MVELLLLSENKDMTGKIVSAPAGKQALFIAAASNDNCLVPAIIEEHKLYFNPCIISLMFMWDPDNCTTWDVHQAD